MSWKVNIRVYVSTVCMQISTQLIPNSENLLKNILLDNIKLWLKGFKVNEKTKNKLRVSKSAWKVPHFSKL